MIDLYLNEEMDIAIDKGGSFLIVDGIDCLAQFIKTAILTQKGSYFWAPDFGIQLDELDTEDFNFLKQSIIEHYNDWLMENINYVDEEQVIELTTDDIKIYKEKEGRLLKIYIVIDALGVKEEVVLDNEEL